MQAILDKVTHDLVRVGFLILASQTGWYVFDVLAS